MEFYTKKQISEIIGRPVRTITFWADEGIIHPDDPREQRPGRARQFSKRNLLEFAMTEIMTKLGIEIKTIKFIMKKIQPGGDIDDFFNDDKLGRDRELVFIEFLGRDGKPQIKIETVSDEHSLLQFMGRNPKNPKSVARIIWLGEIKNQAKELLKG